MWSGRPLYVPEITSLAFPIPVCRKSENGRSASPYESTVANVKSISAATATAARARAVRLRRSRYDVASRTTPTTKNIGSKLTGGSGTRGLLARELDRQALRARARNTSARSRTRSPARGEPFRSGSGRGTCGCRCARRCAASAAPGTYVRAVAEGQVMLGVRHDRRGTRRDPRTRARRGSPTRSR